MVILSIDFKYDIEPCVKVNLLRDKLQKSEEGVLILL